MWTDARFASLERLDIQLVPARTVESNAHTIFLLLRFEISLFGRWPQAASLIGKSPNKCLILILLAIAQTFKPFRHLFIKSRDQICNMLTGIKHHFRPEMILV